LQKYLYVAIGGALGSLARFCIGSYMANRLGTRFPYGTLIVNITACAILGFCLTLMERRAEIPDAWRFLIPIGFVGAYSTFSTFEWEAFSSLEMGAFFIAALYITASVLLGLFAVWCGIVVAKLLS
jgi:CrcB protein